jgi:coenzyme F420 hydrogenase subunit beta
MQGIANKQKNITVFVERNLCAGCGTCAGVCPRDAISMQMDKERGMYVPKINKLCDNCTLCVKACPGYHVDFFQLNEEIFGIMGNDLQLGNWTNCYAGYSTQNDLRYSAASGGLITTLLLYAMDKGIIDGALVTHMNRDKPLEPEPFIARTREEILSAAGSIYCPVPANVALKQINDTGEGERFAIVGLPCHIQGIRKWEKSNPILKNRIVFHLGIFCSHCDTFKSTDYLVKKYKVSKAAISSISYRGMGWPGYLKFGLNDKTEIKVFYADYIDYHALRFFIPRFCLFCCDAVCQLSDLTFMDAWLPEIKAQDKTGTSFMISRSSRGRELVEAALKDGVIALQTIDRDSIISSQGNMQYPPIDSKIIRDLFRALGQKVPIYRTESMKGRLKNYIRAFVVLFNYLIGSKFGSVSLIDGLIKIERKFFKG